MACGPVILENVTLIIARLPLQTIVYLTVFLHWFLSIDSVIECISAVAASFLVLFGYTTHDFVPAEGYTSHYFIYDINSSDCKSR